MLRPSTRSSSTIDRFRHQYVLIDLGWNWQENLVTSIVHYTFGAIPGELFATTASSFAKKTTDQRQCSSRRVYHCATPSNFNIGQNNSTTLRCEREQQLLDCSAEFDSYNSPFPNKLIPNKFLNLTHLVYHSISFLIKLSPLIISVVATIISLPEYNNPYLAPCSSIAWWQLHRKSPLRWNIQRLQDENVWCIHVGYQALLYHRATDVVLLGCFSNHFE